MAATRHDIDDFGEGRFAVDGDDISSRNHDIVDGKVSDAEDIREKHPLVIAERRLVFIAGFFDQLVQRIAHRGFAIAHKSHPAQGSADHLA
jgi:hypothetical protein